MASDKEVIVSAQVDPKLKLRLMEEAKRNCRTLSSLVHLILTEHYRRQEEV